MNTLVVIFWVDFAFIILSSIMFLTKSRRIDTICEQFQHSTTNNEMLMSNLLPDLVTLSVSVVRSEEEVLYRSIPSTYNFWTDRVKWIFSVGNFSLLVLGSYHLLLSNRNGTELQAWPFYFQLIASILIIFFSFKILEIKLGVMYLLTDQRVYLFGNYHLNLTFSFVNEYRCWDLDKLPEFTVIRKKQNEGDIIFEQENNPKSSQQLSPIGFRFISSIDDVELLIRKEMELKAISTNTNKIEQELPEVSDENFQNFSEKDLELELQKDLNQLNIDEINYQQKKEYKKD
ncbi:hypothetical protein M0813_15054 [Anaeramoeba flamelloides]|uniref:Transmembrane protein n=1 Tax=Anaeramoeba flamelloides TaxID=1746091 RepID=A0AAV8A0P0_9EUKA|nr:hypothetical protein M0812_07281 [Anaeramoeba flamelloides]KAJ6251397.1 hypothetical protein M0813_15054 [Anaeramoeba flamelloides]